MESKELPKTYDHHTSEPRIYKLWEKSGFFNPDKLPRTHKQPFSIIMPPTNANGSLHIGHALGMTLQDIMIRYNRMQGKRTLWLPGMDHAGFETQIVYDKKLAKEERSRFDMTREQYYKEVWDYTKLNSAIVRGQIKQLGASCDWSRETFTLDKHVVQTVYDTFKKMADEGLIYRAERLVNYCTKHRTAFSDVEIKHEERKDPLYYIKYGPITLATVRPETKFGDTAIAVHPGDKRYAQYVGKEIEIKTLLGKNKIKVIADDAVDPAFGTGAVKVTPAHDQTDFEIWQRHKDEIPGPIQVIGQDGKLTKAAGPYEGLKVEEARQRVALDLQVAGLMEKIDNTYMHTVSLCYKCATVIEPMLMKQWFVKMQPLAKLAVKAAQKKDVVFIPKNQEKIYLHWMRIIRDWNISRQNWWGISIPAWKCAVCSTPDNEVWVTTNGKQPKACTQCKTKEHLERDSDVFDTWFSSTQWPYATLQYPDGKDFKTFYPTSVMETGYDILFFWVARMIMMGTYRTGKVPFKMVYLHGLVRDKDRQKMSKSKGNVVDPLGVIDLYGADALRMGLVVGSTPGQDPVVSEEKIRGYRNFSTKLWNMRRFLDFQLEDYKATDLQVSSLSLQEKKLYKTWKKTLQKITRSMEHYRFSQAAEDLYRYAWHAFADRVIEDSKPILQNKKTRASRQRFLVLHMKELCQALHPFMPFVTEEIYQSLPLKKKTLLIIEQWPS